MKRAVALAFLPLIAALGGERHFELEVARVEGNVRQEDRRFALYEEDAYNRALVCPDQRAATQPADTSRMRCTFLENDIRTEPPIRAGASITRHEHDGMYGVDEDVVLTLADGTILATLTQLALRVDDGRSTLSMRRQRAMSDADGPDLCVENVSECGAGLFRVMDLGARAWRPTARRRGVDAFVITADRRLVRAPSLDGMCPSRGYEPFVAQAVERTDPFAGRRGVQGEPVVRAPRGVGRCF